MAELSLTKQAGLISLTDSARFVVKSILGIVLARILSQDDYGSYRQLFLIYTTLSTVLLMGLPPSMMYFIPKLKSIRNQREFIARSVDIVTVLALVMLIGVYISRDVISQGFNNPKLANLLVYFAFYPVFMLVNQIFSSIMMGLKRPLEVVKFSCVTIVSDLIVVLGLALLTRDLKLIVIALVASAFIQWLYVRIKLRQVSIAYSFTLLAYREQLVYALPLGFASIVGILAVQLDKFVISGYFSPAQYAVFSVGAAELPFIGILVNSVNSVILPTLSASSDKDEIYSLYSGSVRKNALLIFPTATLFFVIAVDLMSFLYSFRYASAATYFRIYLVTLLMRVGTYGVIFQATNQTKFIMQNAVFTLVANLGLNFILVNSPLKMMGPAIATVIVTYAAAALYLWQIKTKLKFNLRAMFPLGQLSKTMFSAVLAGLIVTPIGSIFPSSISRLVFVSIVYIAIYLILAYLTKSLLDYDVANLKKNWQELKVRILA